MSLLFARLMRARRRVDRAVPWAIESLESRLLLSAVSWTGAGDGVNWTDARNWSSNPVLPGVNDDVTINVTGGPTIQISAGTQSIHSLVSSDPLAVGATLAVSTTAQFSANITMLNGGTLAGGTYTAAGGAEIVVMGQPTGGSSNLSGLTLNGNMDLSQVDSSQVQGANLLVENGLTLNGTMYVGNAAGSNFATVYFDAGTLGGAATVLMGGNVYDRVFNDSTAVGPAGTLTIAPGVMVHGNEGFFGNYYINGTILNQGIIVADVSGGTLSVGGGPLINQGTLEAANGGTLRVSGLTGNLGTATLADNGSALLLSGTGYVVNQGLSVGPGQAATLGSTWSNSPGSTISAGTGATLTLGDGSSDGAWSNAGTISATGSTVDLEGNFTQASLGMFNPSAGTVVNLFGTLNGNLSLSPATGSWNLGGTIENGVVTASGGTSLSMTSNSDLNGVTLATNLVIPYGGGGGGKWADARRGSNDFFGQHRLQRVVGPAGTGLQWKSDTWWQRLNIAWRDILRGVCVRGRRQQRPNADDRAGGDDKPGGWGDGQRISAERISNGHPNRQYRCQSRVDQRRLARADAVRGRQPECAVHQHRHRRGHERGEPHGLRFGHQLRNAGSNWWHTQFHRHVDGIRRFNSVRVSLGPD